MIHPHTHNRRSERGFALVVVLGFVVLLSGLVVAYLGRTATDRQLATGSVHQSIADELARSALDTIVGDFKQEIVNGSSGSSPPYTLTSDANIVPMRSGNPPDVPNLIRRSVRSDSVAAPPAVASRASAVNSSADPSLNRRSVSLGRWNSHYLIPKLNLSNDHPQPIGSFSAPDWVLVSRSGPSIRTGIGSGSSALNNSVDTNPDYVVGRYAYAVYDEGGLLDMNVAGYPVPAAPPPPSYPTEVGRKGTVAFADLTALPTTNGNFVTNTPVNRLIGWRNYATVQPGVSPQGFPEFTFDADAVSRFVTHFLNRAEDFRIVATNVDGAGTSRRTDQSFITRRELIRLRSSIQSGAASMLQYLGTFSRGNNRQTWSDAATRLGNRFPLDKFDLFNPRGNGNQIRQSFGVEYVAASPGTPEHWRYTGALGNTMQPSILVLTGNDQEPDLSVLLRYAYPLSTSDGEILSIIASLIDQRDSSPDTTWIEYGNPAAPPALKAWGADSNPPANPADPRPNPPPVMLKRSFRNVGELGYAYRNGLTSLDFQSSTSVDARLLDLFTYNTAATRAGAVSLNTRNPAVLAALLKGAITSELSAPSETVGNTSATNAANSIVAETTTNPALSRVDVSRLASAAVVTNAPFTGSEEQRETIARALAEIGQTRTWGLMIDVIAQSGRYPSSAANLAQFVVEGEKRYWLHIAIDRFTGEIIDQQLEAVYE